ncbi:MAG: ChbG/HpnK family deacetylase [Puniceicoccales bacterium]|jgi:predicted glycoside hydrolase/deacetylase ChbG (UPF0249 family)|nr:ChbG/HpnK family deacetylase [Puniceicoccales bacterium]
MLKIIINADDLGGFQGCNDAVFELMAKGKISSSTLMANGPFFTDAVMRAKNFHQCSFGVHLNISQFFPLIPDRAFQEFGILDSNGAFRYRKLIIPTGGLIRAIQREWEAQIAKIRDSGITITHIDSHQHVHTRLWMYPILKFICEKFNIKKIRSKFGRHELSRSGHFLKRIVRQVRGVPHRVIQTKMLGLHSTDHFACLGDGLDFLSYKKITADLTIELMCHPGVPHFESDLPTLHSNYESKICSPFRLISYREL